MKDYIDYASKDAKKLTKINKDEIRVGDYADIDGDSGFCYGGYEKITDIITRYNEKTGEPYKVVCCGDNLYLYKSGRCIKGASAYSIFGYYRINEF